MKMKLFAIAALALFFAACNKTDAPLGTGIEEPQASGAKPGITQESIDFTAPFVFPEGVVYDPFNDRFLVSSIAQGTIGSVSPEGVYTPFIVDADLASTVGLEIDQARKRLFVANSRIEGTLAQLAVYDLNTGERLYLIDLAAVAGDGLPHLANDVAVDQQGNAYVTDSYSGIIYKVDRYGNATIFFQDPAFTPAPGAFGFNGIEYSKDGYLLVAYSAGNQIIKIPIDDPTAYTQVQLDTPIISPDGLLLSKDSKQLIVVNNTGGNPGSTVMSFETTDEWATGTNTETFSTGTVFPTTVTSDGKTEYVLYSYIHLLGQQPVNTFTIQPLPFTGNHPF